MHVDDLDARFAFEILAELGDIDIHVAGIVETVVPPDLLEGIAAFKDVVFLVHQHLQQLCLARGNALLLALDGEGLAFFIEQNAAQFDHLLRLLLLDRATQQGLNPGQEHLNGEWLGDIVVAPNGEAFDQVFLQILGCQEYDGYFLVQLPYFLRQGEPVHERHHHVDDADVECVGAKRFVRNLAICGVVDLKSFRCEIGGEHFAQIHIVFCK